MSSGFNGLAGLLMEPQRAMQEAVGNIRQRRDARAVAEQSAQLFEQFGGPGAEFAQVLRENPRAGLMMASQFGGLKELYTVMDAQRARASQQEALNMMAGVGGSAGGSMPAATPPGGGAAPPLRAAQPRLPGGGSPAAPAGAVPAVAQGGQIRGPGDLIVAGFKPNEATAIWNARRGAPLDAKTQESLRKSYLSDPQTKNFRTMRDSYQGIEDPNQMPQLPSWLKGMPANRINDIALIFNFMGLVEPGGRVTDSERVMFDQARPFFESMGINIDRQLANGGIFSNQEREWIRNVARQRMALAVGNQKRTEMERFGWMISPEGLSQSPGVARVLTPDVIGDDLRTRFEEGGGMQQHPAPAPASPAAPVQASVVPGLPQPAQPPVDPTAVRGDPGRFPQQAIPPTPPGVPQGATYGGPSPNGGQFWIFPNENGELRRWEWTE